MRRSRELALAAACGALALVLAAAAPSFFAPGNMKNIAIDAAPLFAAATGMTFVVLAGRIDVSIGAVFAVCGVAHGIASKAGWPPALSALAPLAVGTALGAVNGALTAFGGVPAILATLASMAVLRGLLRLLSGGQWIQGLPENYQWYGLGPALGQTAIAVGAAALGTAAWVAAERTRAGRAIYAAGGDAATAARLGVRVPWTIFGAFAACGACTAVAAMFHFPRFPDVEIESGLGFELRAIAAVVLGGCSISGGRGSLAGTWLGVLLLSLAGSALVFLHADPAWERALQGLILLAAVAQDRFAHAASVAASRG